MDRSVARLCGAEAGSVMPRVQVAGVGGLSRHGIAPRHGGQTRPRDDAVGAPASIQAPALHSARVDGMHWPDSCEPGSPQPRRRTRSHSIGPLVAIQRTVLVVDDDRQLCELLTEFLTEAGYAVQCADNGEAAWAELQRSSPDVVLSDIKMPRLGGIDLASRLISGGYTTPIILMSAGHHDWTGISASFIRKPFDFDRLLATIAAVLDPPTPRRTRATA